MNSLEHFQSNFTDHVGIDVISLEHGEARISLDLRQQHLNSGGMVHGGVLATLADTAAGAAAFSLVPMEKMAVTTDFQMSCLKSSGLAVIEAGARVIHAGRRFMRAEVEITAAGVLLATAGVSFMIIERPTI